MKTTMLLADYAQVAGDKLTVVGAGWSVTPSEANAVPFGIGIVIQVPWDLANRQHRWALELVDADGQPVTMSAPDNTATPIRLDGEFEVGRPPGLLPGVDLQATLAVNSPPLPLPPGQRFEWIFDVNGETAGRCPFSTARA